MYDKFKAICRTDYIGDDSASDLIMSIHDTCNRMSALKLCYRSKKNNGQMEDTQKS